jgi:hypothetical protein
MTEEKIRKIQALLEEIEKSSDILLEVGKEYPSIEKNVKQLKSILNLLKIQFPEL